MKEMKFIGAESRELRAEGKERKTKSRAQAGHAVCNRGLQGAKLNAVGSGVTDRFTNDATPADMLACRAPDNIEIPNKNHQIRNIKSGRNIPVLVSVTTTPDRAASSVRVKALAGYPLPVARSTKHETRSTKPEACGLKLITHNSSTARSSRLKVRGAKLLKYNQCNTLYLPLNFEACMKTTEGSSLLPQGSAGSGDCPGAAAITTIIPSFTSSPRGASEIAGTKRLALLLPVINQSCSKKLSSRIPVFRERDLLLQLGDQIQDKKRKEVRP